MAKESINIHPVKAGSEEHNLRLKQYDYVRQDLSHLNGSYIKERISPALERIKNNYQKSTGQKMQKRATPIREGVVNLNAQHSMADLKRLSKALENEFGIKAIQIYIHRDEGHYRTKASDENWKPNLHAHIVFDWTDKNGKSIKLNRIKMSKMQDLVAEQLSMERGQYASVTGKKHLNPVQFKLEKLKEQEKKQLLEIDRLAEIERKGKSLEIELEISRKNYLEQKELEKKLKQWEGLSIEELQDIIDRKKQKMKEWQERKEVIEMLTPMAFKKAFEVNQNKTVWEDVYFELEQLVIGKIGKRPENKLLMEQAMLKFQEIHNIEFKKSRRLGL